MYIYMNLYKYVYMYINRYINLYKYILGDDINISMHDINIC